MLMFSEEEIEKIRNNLESIAKYIRENYCTRLRGYERVVVPFANEGGQVLKIAFETDGSVYYVVNNNYYSFDRGDANGILSRYSVAFPLFTNWKAAKNAIEEELQRREEERNAILNFSV